MFLFVAPLLLRLRVDVAKLLLVNINNIINLFIVILILQIFTMHFHTGHRPNQ